MDPDARAMWREALRNVAVGWEIVIAIGIGYGLGWGLDRWLHTSPYLKIVGTLLGFLALREIRQAAGQLRGRRLALWATLFWPLLLSWTFCSWAWLRAQGGGSQSIWAAWAPFC